MNNSSKSNTEIIIEREFGYENLLDLYAELIANKIQEEKGTVKLIL